MTFRFAAFSFFDFLNVCSVVGLQVNCAPGAFASGLQRLQRQKCRTCPRGFYCPGGAPLFALRIPCPDNHTTFNPGANSKSDCICAEGFGPVRAYECRACEKGSYKPNSSDDYACIACPENKTTFLEASVHPRACISRETFQLATNAQNSSRVEAIELNFSIRGIPLDSLDAQDEKQSMDEVLALISASLSDLTRLDAGAMEMLPVSAASRALSSRALQEGAIQVFRLKMDGLSLGLAVLL